MGTWYEASLVGSLYKVLISSPSINKHGRHMQFLFLMGRFLKIFSSETALPNSYKVSVHSAKQFQRRRFLEIDQSETIIAYGGHVCLRIKTK
jgi:hypothetical protein